MSQVREADAKRLRLVGMSVTTGIIDTPIEMVKDGDVEGDELFDDESDEELDDDFDDDDEEEFDDDDEFFDDDDDDFLDDDDDEEEIVEDD